MSDIIMESISSHDAHIQHNIDERFNDLGSSISLLEKRVQLSWQENEQMIQNFISEQINNKFDERSTIA